MLSSSLNLSMNILKGVKMTKIDGVNLENILSIEHSSSGTTIIIKPATHNAKGPTSANGPSASELFYVVVGIGLCAFAGSVVGLIASEFGCPKISVDFDDDTGHHTRTTEPHCLNKYMQYGALAGVCAPFALALIASLIGCLSKACCGAMSNILSLYGTGLDHANGSTTPLLRVSPVAEV